MDKQKMLTLCRFEMEDKWSKVELGNNCYENEYECRMIGLLVGEVHHSLFAMTVVFFVVNIFISRFMITFSK